MDTTNAPDATTGTGGYEFVKPLGYGNSARCGYCGKDGVRRLSYYASATDISASFYQKLLDRCWRRSGTLMYRPDQKRSCCPHYTIRLDSTQFRPTRAQRQVANKLNSYVLGEAYKKEAARLYPVSKAEAKQRNNEFAFPARIHEAEVGKVKTPPRPEHELEISLEDNNFTEEKWKVFDNYQAVVHKEPPSDRKPKSFERFLCESPLRKRTVTLADGKEQRQGSYHQCYRLDGELVAVGVLDLLPDCVSSVYFFYHESIQRLAPGRIGALQEIALALEGGYKWWYPGFYIHSCPKMRYKLEYAPSYMLDPVSLQWDVVGSELIKLLDSKPFVSLSLEKQAADDPTDREQKVVTDQQDDNDDDDDEPDTIFDAEMPGIPTLAEMESVSVDDIALKALHNAPLFTTSQLRGWSGSSASENRLKMAITELVAAIGPELKDTICVDFATE